MTYRAPSRWVEELLRTLVTNRAPSKWVELHREGFQRQCSSASSAACTSARNEGMHTTLAPTWFHHTGVVSIILEQMELQGFRGHRGQKQQQQQQHSHKKAAESQRSRAAVAAAVQARNNCTDQEAEAEEEELCSHRS